VPLAPQALAVHVHAEQTRLKGAEIEPHVMTIVLDTLPEREAVVRKIARELARSVREHSLLILAVGLYCVLGRLLPIWLGVTSEYADHLYSTLFFSMAGIAGGLFVVAYGIYLRLVIKPADFIGRFKRDVLGFLTLRRLCVLLPVFALMPFFGATFVNLKMLIPAIQPFSWDPTFAEWDRLLHGGTHPWQWLQPIIGHPYVTSFVNAVYHSWFFLTYGVLLWQVADTTRPRLRMQYLLSFLLIWALLGNAAAIMLSSAGPVYFGRITGLADPFAPLMDYLRQASEVTPVPALGVQDMLWRTYAAKGLAIGGGISAMPSLHVAIAFSFVLLAKSVDRRLTIAAAVFAALILIGSVHLGWHYAIDGYVAILMTWVIWRAVGWLLDRRTVARLLGLAPDSSSGAEVGAQPQPAYVRQ
jgi:hypothetical protein